MRVAEHRNARRAHPGRERGSGRDIRGGLMRQAVYQVHVDRMDPGGAQVAYQARHHLRRLDAVDGGLHRRRERLHTQAGTCHAGGGEGLHLTVMQGARIKLDRDFSALPDADTVSKRLNERGKIIRLQRVGGSAAEVQVADTPMGPERLRPEINLGLQTAGIFPDPAVTVRHAGSASAIPAKLLAEGDVKVNGDGIAGRNLRCPACCLGLADTVAEVRSSRIARVARYGPRGVGDPVRVHAPRNTRPGAGVI